MEIYTQKMEGSRFSFNYMRKLTIEYTTNEPNDHQILSHLIGENVQIPQ